MSFQEVRTPLSICNKALSKIMQQPLAGSLNDPANTNKLTGRECARWYKPTVARLLEQHHWGIATKRAALTPLLTNDRSAEWAAAYQAPPDLAFPVTLSPYAAAGSVSYYKGLGYILATLYGQPIFRQQGSTIYGATAGATLEYVSFDISEDDFTETFEQLVVLYLAAQLATPVAKDRDLAQSLEDEATRKLNTAIAQNLNLEGQRYGEFVSESEMARGSAPILDRALMGWRF